MLFRHLSCGGQMCVWRNAIFEKLLEKRRERTVDKECFIAFAFLIGIVYALIIIINTQKHGRI
jgi:hypothetical protein